MPIVSESIKPGITGANADTPPNSPTQSSSPPSTLPEITQNLVDKLQLLVAKTVLKGSFEVQIIKIPLSEDPKFQNARPRVSKVEYKEVNEVYAIFTLNENHSN